MMLTEGSATRSFRPLNEDRACVLWRKTDQGRELCFAVSDGMGGAQFGDACAQVAVTSANRALSGGVSSVRGAFDCANESVMHMKELAGARDSGATICVGTIAGDMLRLCWAGDTSCFLYRDGSLTPLAPPERTVSGRLINYLGKWHGLAPLYNEVMLAEGDRILVATDGVHVMGSEAMRSRLSEPAGPESTALSLAADGARLSGDDATALVIEVSGTREAKDVDACAL